MSTPPSTSAASAALESLLVQSRLTAHTDTSDASSSMASLDCCCGRAECAYLKHNNQALDGLERNVQTAAQLGQVHDPSSSIAHALS